MSGDSILPRGERQVSKMLSGDRTESGLQTKFAIRAVFVVAALSIHSVIEGMTTGCLAVSMHNFCILKCCIFAISLGVEFLVAEVKLTLLYAFKESYLN